MNIVTDSRDIDKEIYMVTDSKNRDIEREKYLLTDPPGRLPPTCSFSLNEILI